MTNKEIAEPGAVVWWRDKECLTGWNIGFVHSLGSDSSKLRILTPGGRPLQFHEVDWKPACILGPNEMAVKIPSLDDWRPIDETK